MIKTHKQRLYVAKHACMYRSSQDTDTNIGACISNLASYSRPANRPRSWRTKWQSTEGTCMRFSRLEQDRLSSRRVLNLTFLQVPASMNGSKARSRNNSERNLQQCPAPCPRVAKGALAARSLALQLLDRSKDWTAKPRAAADAARLFLCCWCGGERTRAVGGGRRRSRSAAVVLDRMDRCTRARLLPAAASVYAEQASDPNGAAPAVYVLYVHPAPATADGWSGEVSE